MERRRHAPRAHPHARSGDGASDGRPHAALQRSRRRQADVYASDQPQGGDGSPLRWLVSTSLAGAVGAAVIVTAILGWMETQEEVPATTSVPTDRVRWAVPPTDRLPVPAVGAMAVAFTIPERVQQYQNGREFHADRFYQRFEARLAPVSKAQADSVPRLDPMALHADTTPLAQPGQAPDRRRNAAVKVIELLGGTIASEDRQEPDEREIAAQVAYLLQAGSDPEIKEDAGGVRRLATSESAAAMSVQTLAEMQPTNMSILSKSVFEAEDSAESTAAGHTSSLYASLYHTAQALGIQPEALQQVLKVHATTTDFTQSVRAGDAFELFFDSRGSQGQPGHLLASTLVANGERQRFYRFRTTDGVVDYYDEHGSTARKLLLRQPVRCPEARVASGFGRRMHPLLQVMRPHSGVDWACAEGTPIMAAGSGVVEEAGRKGEYGHYIRIRHANGYKTAYGHLQTYAPGLREGVSVRQGQIIGYVGSSGFASGAHVHFEVLIRGRDEGSYRAVDPMSVDAAQERALAGKDLVDFHRERVRIDKLMRAQPVASRVAMGAQRR